MLASDMEVYRLGGTASVWLRRGGEGSSVASRGGEKIS